MRDLAETGATVLNPPVVRRCIAILSLTLATAAAQQSGALLGTEPGLEKAVRWIWTVGPSAPGEWGLELPESAPTPAPGQLQPPNTPPSPNVPGERPTTYVVAKGDSLFRIGRKFGVQVDQLRHVNGLTSDMIRVGDVLNIPSLGEVAAWSPPRPTPKPNAQPHQSAAPQPTAGLPAGTDPEVYLFQTFLSREGFSAGPIDGKTSLDFQKLVFLFQNSRPGMQDIDTLRTKAREAIGEGFASYVLRPEDFRFISPPRAQRFDRSATPTPTPKPGAKKQPAPEPARAPVTYDELTAGSMLAYRSPWEFVAERFRCDEKLLRALNPGVQGLPKAGTTFRVPNVIPFEIEHAFESPLRPAVDPANPVKAVIVDRSRLEVYRGGSLVAVMPVSSARPGLRGRGTWIILDAIQRPKLATRQEPREKPRETSHFFVGANPEPQPTPQILASEQFIAPGPRSPVGILWINLAKSDSPDPLPFGLHGTARPSQMRTEQSLGGFRMPNWDIARVVRLIPAGTPLDWSTSAPPTAAPAAAAEPAM